MRLVLRVRRYEDGKLFEIKVDEKPSIGAWSDRQASGDMRFSVKPLDGSSGDGWWDAPGEIEVLNFVYLMSDEKLDEDHVMGTSTEVLAPEE